MAYYREHNPGYDYRQSGIYHITLVVGHRDNLLGTLNMDPYHPSVHLTDIGQLVWDRWDKTPSLQAKHGNHVQLLQQVVMPNHWHGVIQVEQYMPEWSLGDIIQAVKATVTSHWRKMTGYQESKETAAAIRNMTHIERRQYYDTRPRIEQPLFDDDYDDTICLKNADGTYDSRHRQAMINYVMDNPRRAIILKLNPDFMQRRLHLVIDGRDYAAFGNLFLLRWVRKLQVFCHRKARLEQLTDEERQRHGYTYEAMPEMETRLSYTDTNAYRQQHEGLMEMVLQGDTVVVTPGISPGERDIKKECLEKGYPLIHIQKEPISQYWKPEQQRFEACQKGTLLILSPWCPEQIGSVQGLPSDTKYSIFHNLNTLAQEICRFNGTATVRK